MESAIIIILGFLFMYVILIFIRNQVEEKPFKILYKNGNTQYISKLEFISLIKSITEAEVANIHIMVDNSNIQEPTNFYNKNEIVSIYHR